jgi:RNA polymerase sigma-70 factor (ECF subfamily)
LSIPFYQGVLLVKSRLFKGRERLKQALLKMKEGREKNGGKNF